MARFFSTVACVIVGLQLLIGLPLAIGAALTVILVGHFLGPLSVEIRTAAAGSTSATTAPPRPSEESPAAVPPEFSSILESRADRGSLLAGTALVGEPAGRDADEFVAALKRVAANEPVASCNVPAPMAVPEDSTASSVQADADNWTDDDETAFAALAARYLRHLYQQADHQEEAGDFHRADHYRLLARNFRFGVWTLAEEHADLFPAVDDLEAPPVATAACSASGSPGQENARLSAAEPLPEPRQARQ